MEKINVRFVTGKTSKTGVPFWAVESMGGGKYTAWDKDIAEQLIAKIGQDVEVEIKQSGNFLNIRDIVPAGQVLKEVQQGERSLDGQEQRSVAEERNTSIIAQCLVKACIRKELPIEKGVEMYKKALELLG